MCRPPSSRRSSAARRCWRCWPWGCRRDSRCARGRSRRSPWTERSRMVGRQMPRQRHELEPEPRDVPRPDRGAAAPPVDALLGLQGAAGNRAVARAMLQRDVLPGLNTPLDPSIMAGLDKRQREVEAKIRAWVAQQQDRIRGEVVTGMSLPEVIDLVRSNVKEATELPPETVGKIAASAVAPMSIPAHRLDQRDKELGAELRNAMANVPTELQIGGAGAWAKISISGLEAAAKLGGAELSGEAGPSSGSVGVKHGSAEAKAEVDWDEK